MRITTILTVKLFTISIFLTKCSFAQQLPLKVVDSKVLFRQEVSLDSNLKMINLKQYIPFLVFDLRYATSNNFTKNRLYPKNLSYSFMRLEAAKKLQLVQQELNQTNLGLKIFDAYRPHRATKLMWDLVKDERYVANPSKGSGHNRGIAVDLTIINLSNQKELDMGTGFDNFTDTAHHSFTSLSTAALANRKLLKTTMEKYGFVALETEWWHYYLPNTKDYSVLDLSFKELLKQNK